MSDDLEIWQDVSVTDEGLSIVTYSEQPSDPEPTTEAETYWTWDELLGLVEGGQVWVLEHSYNGTPQSLSPTAVFTDEQDMKDFVEDTRPKPGEDSGSRSWRWSQFEIDGAISNNE